MRAQPLSSTLVYAPATVNGHPLVPSILLPILPLTIHPPFHTPLLHLSSRLPFLFPFFQTPAHLYVFHLPPVSPLPPSIHSTSSFLLFCPRIHPNLSSINQRALIPSTFLSSDSPFYLTIQPPNLLFTRSRTFDTSTLLSARSSILPTVLHPTSQPPIHPSLISFIDLLCPTLSSHHPSVNLPGRPFFSPSPVSSIHYSIFYPFFFLPFKCLSCPSLYPLIHSSYPTSLPSPIHLPSFSPSSHPSQHASVFSSVSQTFMYDYRI